MAQNTPFYRKVMKEFLLIYRSEPCLWQLNHKSYYDKTKRLEALDKLVEKYKEIDQNVDRESVTKKINGLRSSYSYEKRKVKAAATSGYSYEPKLWYFKELSFVDNSRHASTSSLTIKVEREDNEDEEGKEYLVVNFDPQNRADDASNSDGNSQIDEPQTTPRGSKSKKRKHKCVSDPSAGDQGEVSEDSHDIYCKYVASKLRRLPSGQRMLAERLINDVVFEAEWGNLTLGHKVVNTWATSNSAHNSPSPSSQAY